jgi:replicative DNA helicase
MTFPAYIQKAVDLGLLETESGQITGCKKDEVETILGMARLVEKIQPTTRSEVDDTTDQEAIVLIRVLSSPSGKANELWADLRIAFGVGHGQAIPDELWSTRVFRAIGREIDRTFMGERNASLISRESLIGGYASLDPGTRFVGLTEFNKTISDLSDSKSMQAYGDPNSEWNVALDLLRQARVRAVYQETQHVVAQSERSKSKLEKSIEFQQQQLMTCLGMLRGSIGNQGNAVDAVEDLLAPRTGHVSIIDKIMNAREQQPPVSTGIPALDLDMEGGVRPPGQEQGGRLFTLGAHTGVGKTILAVHSAVNLAVNGLVVVCISAELDRASIYARVWAAATRHLNNQRWVSVGNIESPGSTRERDAECIAEAAMLIQGRGGKLLVEDPWGADVDAVINSMRSMKAKNPDLRVVILDHFHCLGRHQKAPANDASMLEERAYKLMTASKELGIDILALAQLNRSGMGSDVTNSKPDESWIRGTAALSHVSHAVWIVRREKLTEEEEAQPNVKRQLEVHHVKTRGRQAFWRDGMRGVSGFISKSMLTMDYAHSSMRSDDTMSQVN